MSAHACVYLPGHDVKYILKSGSDNKELRFHIWPDSVKSSADPPAIVSGKNYLKDKHLMSLKINLKEYFKLRTFIQEKSIKTR